MVTDGTEHSATRGTDLTLLSESQCLLILKFEKEYYFKIFLE